MRSLPSVGRSRQPIRFTSVLLPEPEGPVTATHSPATIENDAWSSAFTCPAWPAYTRVTPCSAITAQSSRVSRSIGLSITVLIFSLALQQRSRLQPAQHAQRKQRRHC